jgi:hypothetical protein
MNTLPWGAHIQGIQSIDKTQNNNMLIVNHTLKREACYKGSRKCCVHQNGTMFYLFLLTDKSTKSSKEEQESLI